MHWSHVLYDIFRDYRPLQEWPRLLPQSWTEMTPLHDSYQAVTRCVLNAPVGVHVGEGVPYFGPNLSPYTTKPNWKQYWPYRGPLFYTVMNTPLTSHKTTTEWISLAGVSVWIPFSVWHCWLGDKKCIWPKAMAHSTAECSSVLFLRIIYCGVWNQYTEMQA